MYPTKERLLEMFALLERMGKGTKLPSDGLGLYLGDGLPRNLPGGPNAGTLRSNELLWLVHNAIVMLEIAESRARMDELLEKMRTDTVSESDFDPELLQLAEEACKALEQRKRDATS